MTLTAFLIISTILILIGLGLTIGTFIWGAVNSSKGQSIALPVALFVLFGLFGCLIITALGWYGYSHYLKPDNSTPISEVAPVVPQPEKAAELSNDEPESSSEPSISLNLRTSGMVEDNHDDGDAVMGTVMLMTRNDPTTDPTLFLVAPGYSIDVEYVGKMYFTTDRYGKATTEQAASFAKSLHDADLFIFVGPESDTPEGFTYWEDATGWWMLRDWKYSEKPIEPKGLVCSEGIFVSGDQTDRTIEAGENEVVYGQFWTPVSPGFVVHIQIRQGESLEVPANWQGTYWRWTGNFKLGELDLQKRMIQATAKEVVDRDDIHAVKLQIAGDLPEGIDSNITSFEFDGETVTWLQNADDVWNK